MKRIAVVGSGGSGKSTFSRALGRELGLPVVHLDWHFWKPGWVDTPRDEWRALQETLLEGREWIVDGNYGGTLDVRFQRADTVIHLDLPRWLCMVRVVRRSVGNLGREVQAVGCPERPNLEFYRWVWGYPKGSRVRLDAALDQEGDRLRVVRLRTRGEVASFLERVAS